MSDRITAEDFARATLATRGKYNYARRIASDRPEPWRDGGGIWLSDAQMAAEGWTPVVESRVTEHTLRDSQESAVRKRQRLVDHMQESLVYTQREATLALAFEQRTQTLLAVATAAFADGSAMFPAQIDSARIQIADRLGLDGETSE